MGRTKKVTELASDAEVEIEIVGEGAFIAPVGADQRRPYWRGAHVRVANELARQLVEDGVAKVATQDGSVVTVVVDVTPPPNGPANAQATAVTDGDGVPDLSGASVEELDAFVNESNSDEVIAAATDAEIATGLLEAEQRRDTPRVGVVSALTKIVDDATA